MSWAKDLTPCPLLVIGASKARGEETSGLLKRSRSPVARSLLSLCRLTTAFRITALLLRRRWLIGYRSFQTRELGVLSRSRPPDSRRS